MVFWKFLTRITGFSFVFLLMNSLAFSQTEVTDYESNKIKIEEWIASSKKSEAAGDYRQASDYLNKAALIEWEAKKYQTAIDLYENSLTLNQKVSNQQGITGIYSNLAMIHADMKSYKKSLDYFLKTLETRKKSKDKVSIISTHINVSIVLNNLKRHNEAAVHLEDALKLARELNDANQMKSCYGMLSETYEKAGNTERSIHYFNLYRTFHEMVQKDKEVEYRESAEKAELKSKLFEEQAKYKELELQLKHEELTKTQSELADMENVLSKFDDRNRELMEKASRVDLLERIKRDMEIIHEEEIQLQEAEIARKNLIQYVLLIGLIAIGVFFVILYRKNQEKKRINHKLKEKNEEVVAQQEQISNQNDRLAIALTQITRKNDRITQSINYAQKIQNAMLQHQVDLNDLFADSFILFKPKDIVSGDFFWFAEKDGKAIVAAVDCTGHGVPGAFMSMIGANLLNQIVGEGITSPEEILTKLDAGVQLTLHQEDTQNKDGMDLAIYTFDKANKTIEFSGAKNPIIYIQNGELNVVKGEKRSVGRNARNDNPFVKHSIDVSEPTSIYIFSDGFQDQFGGPENRKYMLRRLNQKLLAIHQKPMATQMELLQDSFNSWKGTYDQIDDVLVIGTKV